MEKIYQTQLNKTISQAEGPTALGLPPPPPLPPPPAAMLLPSPFALQCSSLSFGCSHTRRRSLLLHCRCGRSSTAMRTLWVRRQQHRHNHRHVL